MFFSIRDMQEFLQLPDYPYCLECYAPIPEGKDPPFCSEACYHRYMKAYFGLG